MGTIILVIAIIVEAAYVTSCLIAKSQNERARSFIRIGALIVFIAFTFLSIIQWSFRWYLLAAFLLIWAALEGWALYHNRANQKVFRPGRIIFNSFIYLLTLFIATAPALIFPQYKPLEVTGKYSINSIQFTFIDKNRVETYSDKNENRKVNVEIWYPENTDEVFPLIVFSHGSFGIKSSNLSLYRELASHGYIVCSLDHPYHSFWTKDKDGQVTFLSMEFMNELQREDAKKDKLQSYDYYQKWMNIRMDDINFVIDTILEQASSEDNEVFSLVDTKRIGVAGHSLGGSAALGIGRQRRDISAVIALESPFLYDITGVEQGEFIFTDEIYPIPVLNIYSDSSWSHLNEWSQYAKNYDLVSNTQANSFNVYITGLRHLSLTDLSLTSPTLVRFLDGEASDKTSYEGLMLINKICLEFLNQFLKSQGEFTGSGMY